MSYLTAEAHCVAFISNYKNTRTSLTDSYTGFPPHSDSGTSIALVGKVCKQRINYYEPFNHCINSFGLIGQKTIEFLRLFILLLFHLTSSMCCSFHSKCCIIVILFFRPTGSMKRSGQLSESVVVPYKFYFQQKFQIEIVFLLIVNLLIYLFIVLYVEYLRMCQQCLYC